ncbi:MAG: hypothetical protein Q9161_009071 [Pseudevernia consocians]
MSSPATHRPSANITTDRLLLRPLSPTDIEGVFAIRSDPKVFYWTEPDTREKSDEWLKRMLENEKSMVYTVSLLPSTDNRSPRIIGIIGAHSVPEIGYVFHPDSWGRGYATEALKAWIHMYWQRYPDGHPVMDENERAYLKAVTGPGGDGSRGVLRKCGFRWFGEEEVDDERKGAKQKGLKVVLEEFRLARPGVER